MAYEKRALVDNETVIDKDLLDHMQDGIVSAHNEVESVKDANYVKTVNSVTPDENGNVQIDFGKETEELEFTYTTSYPQNSTFNYTESADVSNYWLYKKSALTGGLLRVDWDTTQLTRFDIVVYLFDADGNPYKYIQRDYSTVNNSIAGEKYPVEWCDAGLSSGYCKAIAPFSIEILDGCHVMVSMRTTNAVYPSTSTITTTLAQVAPTFFDVKVIKSTGLDTSDCVKSINGVGPDENGNVQMDVAVNYDLNVKAVNHRGFSTEAPENTIPAYILSKKKGFTYVECDVSFTKDGVAVLLHDGTIDRTSDGSGNISDLTYAEVFQYDFGSWKSSAYAGTKIPTFKEFIILCRNLGLHPYIELKSNGSYTKEQIHSLVDMVDACGMKGKVTWISFSATFLAYIRDYDKTARLGYVCWLNSTTIDEAKNLQTDDNEVFLDCNYADISATNVAACIEAGISLEVFTVNSAEEIKHLNPYISGVTSDKLIAGKILYDTSMTYVAPEYTIMPLVDISMVDGTNVGTGGSKYNATLKNGGTFTNNQFTTVNGAGAMDIATDFIADRTSEFTIFMVFDSWAFSENAYQRFFAGAYDSPAFFADSGKQNVMLKLLDSVLSTTTVDYYDSTYWTTAGRLYYRPTEGEKLVIAIRCDGEKWSFWADGILRASQLCSADTTTTNRSTFWIGDGSTRGYSLGELKCSKVKMWDVALSDAEMASLVD